MMGGRHGTTAIDGAARAMIHCFYVPVRIVRHHAWPAVRYVGRVARHHIHHHPVKTGLKLVCVVVGGSAPFVVPPIFAPPAALGAPPFAESAPFSGGGGALFPVPGSGGVAFGPEIAPAGFPAPFGEIPFPNLPEIILTSPGAPASPGPLPANVPEPPSWAILAAALVLLGFVRAWRRR